MPEVSLVTLSACETALLDPRDATDEAVGLPYGFLQAGVPAVWGSLWKVPDSSTALLMIQADERLRMGAEAAQALRGAQQWLRDLTARDLAVFLSAHSPARPGMGIRPQVVAAWRKEFPGRWTLLEANACPFAHPYYWAGFQHIGA